MNCNSPAPLLPRERRELLERNRDSEQLNENYNKNFEMHELKQAIKSLKMTSPGKDMVHNSFFRHLPEKILNMILSIMNNSFNNCYIPPPWKQALILPLLKPGKQASLANSYRPVSLLSCMNKLMERLVCDRLVFLLENERKLSSTQGGFRRRLTTIDQISRIESAIRNAKSSKQICLVVFIDLSAAFDTVWHQGLMCQLAASGLQGKLLGWLENYLDGRSFQVIYEGELSTQRKISSGVPQGGILSPVLFNVMLSALPKIPGIEYAEYADDIALFAVGKDALQLVQLLQKGVDSLASFCQNTGFKMNADKTKAMYFTNRKVKLGKMKIGNSKIKYVNEYKYLGLIFDSPRLNWTKHIEYLKTKVLKCMNILKAV